MGAGLKLYQSFPVLVWLLVGLLLRFHNLALKPPWTDEFSTLVFGLGHGFSAIPLNQLIDTGQILAPLEWIPVATVHDTVRALLTESNHPPLYFALTHQWMDGWRKVWWSGEEGILSPYVFLGLARSLSVCFGALGIPVIYVAAWWMWRSHRLAHFAAILMTLSPFGIYLAQEARHYTLTVIWLVGSLACLVAVMRRIRDRQLIPLWLGLVWIVLNGLGLATHYFFALSLLAEAVALLWCWWEYRPKQPMSSDALHHYQSHFFSQPQSWSQAEDWLGPPYSKNLGRVGAIAGITVIAGSIWLPSLLTIRHGPELIRWVQIPTTPDNWSQPLTHTMASIASMVYLLPIQGVGVGIMVLSGLTLVIVTAAAIRALLQALAWKRQTSTSILYPAATTQEFTPDTLPLVVIGRVCLSAIAIMVLVTYGFGFNISPVFRYHFVYFPAVLLLMAWGLTQMWDQYRWLVRIILSIGLCGAITVSTNLGYQKLHRPDQVVQTMLAQSHHPLVISISHQSHGQTGRLMAVAWQMHQFSDESVLPSSLPSPQFFLDHQSCDRPGTQNCNSPSPTLRQTLDTLDHPYDLWLINYLGTTDLNQHHCAYQTTQRFDGYKVQHYTCSTQQYAKVEST